MGKLADALKHRILTIDLERLPGLAPVWQQKTTFVSASTWRRMPSTLCYSARWYGQKRVLFGAAWDGHEQMVQQMWDLYDQADIVITYNGRRADNEWARGDWVRYDMPQPRPWKDVDLYVHGKQFGFPSRSLAHLCEQLGVEGKSGHYDMDVAEAAANGHRESQRLLRRYNTGDIAATERVYERLRPWISNHPHIAVSSSETPRCNRCGSDQLEPLPTPYTADVLVYPQMRCGNCGGISRSGSYVRRIARTRGVRS